MEDQRATNKAAVRRSGLAAGLITRTWARERLQQLPNGSFIAIE